MKTMLCDHARGSIVMVHGAFEHSGRYDWLANKWNENGFHVVYGDLPGQGENKENRGHIDSFDEYIETISAWLEKAKTLNRNVFLLGHSMGGLAVIRTMEEKQPQVKGVILSSPALGIKDGPSRMVHVISKVLDRLYPGLKVKTRQNPGAGTRNEEFHARDLQDPLILKKVSVRWYHEFLRAIEQAFTQIQKYPDVPTLIMQAGEDRLVYENEVEKWYNQISITYKRFKKWEQLYHEIFNEPEREEVFDFSLSFVEQVLNEETEGH
ncbi:MAG: alpha/beta hydrolase [Bacillaceae bacterium]|nr:alpha/beta hydrolase [Bacillaceae bacterium]